MNVVGAVASVPQLGALAAAVRVLAGEVSLADGAPPLDEAQLLDLDGVSVAHVLVYGAPEGPTPERLLGYLQVSQPDLRTTDAGAGIVVAPRTDRAVVTDVLLAQAEQRTEPGHLVLWSRSARSPVGPAALRRAYRADRALLTMASPLSGPDPVVSPVAGVDIRAFVPGKDDAAFLTVNAAAFAGHPEQGAWTAADLARRIAAPWFDAAGFLLAIDDRTGELLGFHWTKLHPGAPPVAEVYVLAIAPRAQGRGLGKLLLDAGLAHLRTSGADEVILYVEESNDGAVHLYERTGFAITRRQVQYRRP